MPRKTDSSNPLDWLWIAEEDLGMVRLAAQARISFTACRGKLAEVVEKALKAELIRTGWILERTHDLQHLRDLLVLRGSDLALEVKPLCDGLADAYFTDRYPGFDFDEPDWLLLTSQMERVAELLAKIKQRAAAGAS